MNVTEYFSPTKSHMFDPIYYVLLAYFIGLYSGIFLSVDYVNKYFSILNGFVCVNESDVNESDVNESNHDSSNNDSSNNDELYDTSMPMDEVMTHKFTCTNTMSKEDIRDTIDTLYISTNGWDDFVPLSSIYKRIQILYPNVSWFIVKDALNIEPNYITGTHHNTKGIRYIKAV